MPGGARGNDFLFGYGSLAGVSPPGYVTELRRFRRCWGVAMDNSETIPGYKYYVDGDGVRPEVYVAFLDIRPDPGATVNGTCIPVEPEEIRRIDARERNYARMDVTDAIDAPLGRVWAYVGSADGRRRLSHGRESGRAVISRAYLDGVAAGFRALGPPEYESFSRSADPDGLPVRDLLRVDLPE